MSVHPNPSKNMVYSGQCRTSVHPNLPTDMVNIYGASISMVYIGQCPCIHIFLNT